MPTLSKLTAVVGGVALACGVATVPAQAATASITARSAAVTTADGNLSPEQTKDLLEQIKAVLPDDHQQRLAQLNELVGVDADEQQRRIQQAIDPDNYDCEPTPLNAWISEQVADWNATDRKIIQLTGVMNWAAYDALLYGPEGPQYYGRDGQFTHEITKSFSNLRSFWGIPTSNMQLAAMHSIVVTDRDQMMRLLTDGFGYSEDVATKLFNLVAQWIDQPKFGYGHDAPLLTFNAFAYSDEGSANPLGIPDRIVMGDGILRAMADLGLGDVAPSGILAHEFGHQIQYELGLFGPDEGTPKGTRKTELEADAFAGYFLSHPRGERLRTKRVEQFVRSFAYVGDCSFSSPGHHGTPDQRAAAAAWAHDLANRKGAKGHILSAQEVSDRFRSVLPEIVAPNAA